VSQRSDSHDRSTVFLLFLWLFIQLVCVVAAASHRSSIQQLLFIQFALSGMFFPYLLRSAGLTLVVALTAIPFVLLASSFPQVPILRAMLVWFHLAMWLCALALFRVTLPKRFQLTAIAVFNFLTLGIPLLAYLHAEVKPNAPLPWWTVLSPPLNAIGQLDPNAPLYRWLPPAAMMLFASVLFQTKWGRVGMSNK